MAKNRNMQMYRRISYSHLLEIIVGTSSSHIMNHQLKRRYISYLYPKIACIYYKSHCDV